MSDTDTIQDALMEIPGAIPERTALARRAGMQALGRVVAERAALETERDEAQRALKDLDADSSHQFNRILGQREDARTALAAAEGRARLLAEALSRVGDLVEFHANVLAARDTPSEQTHDLIASLRDALAGSEAAREPECPGPDCKMCSGEMCAQHGTDPCECDSAERHERVAPPNPCDQCGVAPDELHRVGCFYRTGDPDDLVDAAPSETPSEEQT